MNNPLNVTWNPCMIFIFSFMYITYFTLKKIALLLLLQWQRRDKITHYYLLFYYIIYFLHLVYQWILVIFFHYIYFLKKKKAYKFLGFCLYLNYLSLYGFSVYHVTYKRYEISVVYLVKQLLLFYIYIFNWISVQYM